MVLDKRCQENVTEAKTATADCHDQEKSLLKEGSKIKRKHWCLGIAETDIKTQRSMKSMQEH